MAGDILEYTNFFVADAHVVYDEAAFEKRLRTPPEAVGVLRKFQEGLSTVEPFNARAWTSPLAPGFQPVASPSEAFSAAI